MKLALTTLTLASAAMAADAQEFRGFRDAPAVSFGSLVRFVRLYGLSPGAAIRGASVRRRRLLASERAWAFVRLCNFSAIGLVFAVGRWSGPDASTSAWGGASGTR